MKILKSNKCLALSLISFLLLTLVIGSLVACNKDKTVFDIQTNICDLVCSYDEASETLEVKENFTLKNNTGNVLTSVNFFLPMNAYRKDAKFKPYLEKDCETFYYGEKNFSELKINEVLFQSEKTTHKITGCDKNILSVFCSDPFKNNKIAKITINYSLKLPKCTGRLGITKDTINLGDFYPILCVYENGKFYESPYYAMGDPYYNKICDTTVTFTIPNEYTLATSGTKNCITANEHSKTIEINVPSCRNYAAVLSKKFKTMTAKVNNTNVDYYYLNDKSPDKNLQTSTNVIGEFSRVYGVYPYKNLSVVETPFCAGGMEYSNLVYVTPNQSDEIYEHALIHEIAHQWWYGVVGSNQIDAPYLDESLTEFSVAYFYKLQNHKDKHRAMIKNMQNTVSNNMKKLNIKTANITKSLGKYKTTAEYFILVYQQGALLYQRLLEIYGQSKFEKALHFYYEQNKFKLATTNDLKFAFEKYCIGSSKLIENWLIGNTR